MRELTSAARSLKEGYESLLEKHKELECEKKSLLAEIAALNWKVQELERNLEYGAKVVVKTAEKLYYEKQQNKRYREALKKIKKEETVTTGLSEGQVAYTISGHIARKA